MGGREVNLFWNAVFRLAGLLIICATAAGTSYLIFMLLKKLTDMLVQP